MVFGSCMEWVKGKGEESNGWWEGFQKEVFGWRSISQNKKNTESCTFTLSKPLGLDSCNIIIKSKDSLIHLFNHINSKHSSY